MVPDDQIAVPGRRDDDLEEGAAARRSHEHGVAITCGGHTPKETHHKCHHSNETHRGSSILPLRKRRSLDDPEAAVIPDCDLTPGELIRSLLRIGRPLEQLI